MCPSTGYPTPHVTPSGPPQAASGLRDESLSWWPLVILQAVPFGRGGQLVTLWRGDSARPSPACPWKEAKVFHSRSCPTVNNGEVLPLGWSAERAGCGCWVDTAMVRALEPAGVTLCRMPAPKAAKTDISRCSRVPIPQLPTQEEAITAWE